MSITPAAFGYFDGLGQKPAYDPGLCVPCPICLQPVGETNIITESLMSITGDRSYFFRAHKPCWQSASDDEKRRIEGVIIDWDVKRQGEEA